MVIQSVSDFWSLDFIGVGVLVDWRVNVFLAPRGAHERLNACFLKRMWLFVGGPPTNYSLFVGGPPMNYSLFVGGPPTNISLFVGCPPMTNFSVVGGPPPSTSDEQ